MTYALTVVVAARVGALAVLLVLRYLFVSVDDVLVRQVHPLDLEPLLHPDRRVIKLHQVRQRLYDELSVERMLRDWIIPQPKDLQFLTILQAPDLEEIRNLILSQVKFSEVRRMLEVLQLRNLVEGQGADLERSQILNDAHLLQVAAPHVELFDPLQVVRLAFLDD